MTGTEATKGATREAPTEFEGVNPILRVGDLTASIEYYVQVLGFKLDWRHEDIIASVSRGRCHIFLCEGDQGNPGSWVWIGVGDAGALFEEYKGRRARIRNPPANFPWAYEMQVEDLDGNVLRMGRSRCQARRMANGAICTGTCGSGRRKAGTRGDKSAGGQVPGFRDGRCVRVWIFP